MCGLVSGGTIAPVILAEFTKSLCVVFIFFSFSTLYGLNNDALVEDSKNCNRHLLHTLNDNLTNVT